VAGSTYDLTTLDGLLGFLEERGNYRGQTIIGQADGTFCAGCGATRRMALAKVRWVQATDENARFTFDQGHATPALFVATCLQCQATLTVVAYRGPSGPAVVAMPSTHGGLSTPRTPEAVAFYLDQAHRSESVGALSAAVAMYRAALEQLLYEQGFEKGMLKQKINDLLETEDPPAWREVLNPAFLEAMKDLGNAAIHPNDGEIAKQAALESDLLREIRALFEELLDQVYEQPGKRAERLERMQAAARTFKDDGG
jgi:hypothetical protein